MRFVQSLLWGIVLLAVFVASAYLAFNLFIRRGAMTVPELAGLTSEEASRLLADQGLRYRSAEPAGRWNITVDEGRVIESRPRAGGSGRGAVRSRSATAASSRRRDGCLPASSMP